MSYFHALVYLPYLFVLSVTACGSADFSGGSEAADSRKGKEVSENQTPDNMSIVWEWACSSDESSLSETEHEITLKGPGPHQLDLSKVDGAPVFFKGEACAAQKVSRDVVFVIDVSGSMYNGNTRNPGGTDPFVNGSCGRFQALENVISVIQKESDARFGVVTFHTNVKNASTKLYGSKAELYAELMLGAGSGVDTIEELICAGLGGTNYDAGLDQAGKLLQSQNEKNRAQEIYFISDGVPEPAANNGKAIAATLKKSITIATVMVGGSNDSIMKDFVASKDHLGSMLHARAEYSSKLAEVLAKLSTNTIVSAEVQYGAIGEDGQIMDIGSKISGASFNFQAFTINTSDARDGIAVEFIYKDRFGSQQKSLGELRWNAP